MFERNKKEMAGKISCTPRDAKDKEQPSDRLVKPPSLAGVEKFIRAKVTQVVGGTRHEHDNEHDGDSAAKTSNEEGSNDTGGGDKEQEEEEDKASTDDGSPLLPQQSSLGNDNDHNLRGGTGVTADTIGSVNV
jgi:hypothetical protein